MRTANIIDHFGSMPDPREDNRRHKLIEILFIVICAAVCGAETWNDIEAFGKATESWLRKYLELPHGATRGKRVGLQGGANACTAAGG